MRTDSPRLVTLVSGGLELAVWEWSGNGPPLLFFHATGFHGRCWDQVIRRLPGRRAFAFDLRGHGRSSKPEPPYSWMPFASDSAALAQHLGIRGGLAVGHSMGGHTALAVAIERPAAVAALVLLDPTVFPCSWYGHPSHDVSYIRKRRAAFRSPEEMFERFRSRPPFVTWDPLVLRDYCEGGLLPDGCGGFVLACPPPVEASLYENCLGAESNLHPFLDAVKAPVTVLRAGGFWTAAGTFSLTASPTDPDLVSKFPRARDVLLAGRDHYFPLESPDLVSTEIERSLAAQF